MVLDPFQIGSLRIVIASLVLLPIAVKHIRKIGRKTFFPLLVTGVCGNLIPATLFPLAETNIDSALAGLLNTTTTIFVMLIGVVIYKVKPSLKQIIGLAIGTTGLYLVLYGYFDPSETRNPWYALFIFPATFCYAISLTTIKFKLSNLPPSSITALSFLMIALPALIMALVFNAFDPIINHPDGVKAFGYLSVLAVVGTAIAVLLFTKLIAISNHIFSSAVAYMLPVVATFIGVLDGEEFPLINLLWIALIIGGVYLMNKRSKA